MHECTLQSQQFYVSALSDKSVALIIIQAGETGKIG